VHNRTGDIASIDPEFGERGVKTIGLA